VLRAPELDTVLQVGSHQGRERGQNILPQPAGHVSYDAVQDMVGLLDCEYTLLGCVEFLVNQQPQGLLLRVALNPFSAQPVFVLGIALTYLQDPALDLMKFTQAHLSSLVRSLWMASLPFVQFKSTHF